MSEAKRRDTADLEKRVLKLQTSLAAQAKSFEARQADMDMNMKVELETVQEELQLRREKQCVVAF